MFLCCCSLINVNRNKLLVTFRQAKIKKEIASKLRTSMELPILLYSGLDRFYPTLIILYFDFDSLKVLLSLLPISQDFVHRPL